MLPRPLRPALAIPVGCLAVQFDPPVGIALVVGWLFVVVVVGEIVDRFENGSLGVAAAGVGLLGVTTLFDSWPALDGSFVWILRLVLVAAVVATAVITKPSRYARWFVVGVVLVNARVLHEAGYQPHAAAIVVAATVATLWVLSHSPTIHTSRHTEPIAAAMPTQRPSAGRFGQAVLLAAAAVVVATIATAGLSDETAGAGTAAATGWGIGQESDILDRPERTEAIVGYAWGDTPGGYWRATTSDTWDGRYWTNEQGVNAFVPLDPGFVASPVPYLDTLAPATRVRRRIDSFQYARGGSDAVISQAWTTDVYIEPDHGVVIQNTDGTMRAEAAFAAWESHTIYSNEVVATPAMLRNSDPLDYDLGEGFRSLHLEHRALSPRIVALAAEITADDETSYDRARSLEDWFDANLTYSLRAPLPPTGTDPLEFILFDDQRGYCNQIATAMVLMARSQGIPARVAAGWVSRESDEDGGWIVRSKNAHAWAELYFPGVGWVTFDPTDGVLPSDSPTAVDDGAGPASLLRYWPIAVVAAVVALLIGLGPVVGRFIRGRPEAASPPDRRWVLDAAARLYAVGASAGHPIAPTETLRDFARRLEESGLEHPDLAAMAATLDAAAHGPLAPPADVRGRVDEILDELELVGSNAVP